MRFGFLLSQHCSRQDAVLIGHRRQMPDYQTPLPSLRVWTISCSRRGTPYRYGGMSRRGVDCSGFVVVTMRDKFDLQLPRDTREQSKSAPESIKMNCCPEIWFSLKPVRAKVVYMLVFTIQIMSLFMPLPVVAWCVHRWIMCTGEKLLAGTANLTSQTI